MSPITSTAKKQIDHNSIQFSIYIIQCCVKIVPVSEFNPWTQSSFLKVQKQFNPGHKQKRKATQNSAPGFTTDPHNTNQEIKPEIAASVFTVQTQGLFTIYIIYTPGTHIHRVFRVPWSVSSQSLVVSRGCSVGLAPPWPATTGKTRTGNIHWLIPPPDTDSRDSLATTPWIFQHDQMPW